MPTTYLHAVSSLDGYIADEHDRSGRCTIGISTASIASPKTTMPISTVVAAGDVGGQALSMGLIDRVAMNVVPVVFGRGKPYFGTLDCGHQLLEDPDTVIQGDRVLHLRFPVRRAGAV